MIKHMSSCDLVPLQNGRGAMDLLPLAKTPVSKGPWRQPYEVLHPCSVKGESPVGLGKAILGGPARPRTASCYDSKEKRRTGQR
jgi:hypothetical protein